MTPQLRALVAAVLERAYRDLAAGPRGNGHDVTAQDYWDARRFVESPWFATLCEAVDLDVEATRAAFLKKAG